MRTGLAILAAVGAGFGVALAMNRWHDKLPAFVTEDSTKGHLAYAAMVAVPTLVAFALVSGSRKKVGGVVPVPAA